MQHVNHRKTVLLYATVDTFDATLGAPRLALSVCQTANAALTALLYNLESNAPPSSEGRSAEALEAFSTARETKNAENCAAVLQIAQERGIDCVTETRISHAHGVPGSITDFARLHDLVVVGVDRHGMLSDRAITEHLIFAAGRPILIAPSSFAKEIVARRLVVAWDNSISSARALADALAFFPSVGELTLLTIGDEKSIDSSLNHDATANALSRKNLQVTSETRTLAGRNIDAAIQETAIELGADLLVMGAYGHSRMREFFLGGATAGVLQRPSLPILLAH